MAFPRLLLAWRFLVCGSVWGGRRAAGSDPEVLLRILLTGYLYGITSERKLVEETRANAPTACALP